MVGLRVLISSTEDPGYLTPWPMTFGLVALEALVALVAVLALRAVPGLGHGRARRTKPPPKSAVVGLVAGYLTMAFLTTLLPLGLDGPPLMGDLMSQPFRLVAAAMTGLAAAWLVQSWATRTGWSDRHRVWLIGGVLVSHTTFMTPASVLSIVLGSIAVVVQIVLLALLGRKLARRRPADPVVRVDSQSGGVAARS